MTASPVEWWQWLALLGPIAAPLIIATATLTGAGIATAVALRTLKQRDLADRKAEWWRRAQWAFDALHSESVVTDNGDSDGEEAEDEPDSAN